MTSDRNRLNGDWTANGERWYSARLACANPKYRARIPSEAKASYVACQRLQSESCLLETNRGTVEYHMEGAGPVVLVLHGGPGGYDQGMAMAHLLAQSASTFLSLSRPGYRRTPLSSGQTPEAQADLFAATLDALNVSRVTVIAFSGGGPSALQFALRFPHRCRGLLLICALSLCWLPVVSVSQEDRLHQSVSDS